MTLLHSTPNADGFQAPAEWRRQARTWMIFPERADTWRDDAVPAQAAFARVASAISRFQPVTVCVSAGMREHALNLLPSPVHLLEMDTDDCWMRDTGPTFVVNAAGEVRGVDWRFNAWGELFTPYQRDDAVARRVLAHLGVERYRAPMIAEGGALHVDGRGTLITTRECLVQRNPDLSLTEIEQCLQDYLGVRHIIWLDQGVYMDETGGHVDNVCCFTKPGTVALTWTDDKNDPQYERSAAAYDTLRSAVDVEGRDLRVHTIHQPLPQYMSADEAAGLRLTEASYRRKAGMRLAASYINFVLVNGGLIAPTFNDPNDAAALATLQALFPDRRVVGVYAREVLLGGGGLHCITHEQPAPV